METVLRLAIAETQDVSTFVDMVCPFGPESVDGGEREKFNPLHPTLRATGLKDKEMSLLFLKLTVSERITPALAKGQSCKDELPSLLSKLAKMCASRPVSLEPILSAALDELSEICEYFAVLSQAEVCGADGLKALDALKFAKSGVKQLVRKAVCGSSYWSSLEQGIRRRRVAESSLGPEIQTLRSGLQGVEAASHTASAVRQLPVFKDQLRPSLVEPLVADVKLSLEKRLSDAEATPQSCVEVARLSAEAHKVYKENGFGELEVAAKKREAELREIGLRDDVLAMLSAFVAAEDVVCKTEDIKKTT